MSYAIHNFNLSQPQLKHLENALANNKPITLTIAAKNFNGSHPLPVTEAEMKRVNDGLFDVKISLSKKKLQFIKDNATHEGGFLPLLSLIPLVLGGLGAAGGVASGISSAVQAANANKNERAKLAEQERHNKEIEANLQSGKGVEIPIEKNTVGVTECPRCGSVLQVKAKRGKGIYLKPYSEYSTGSGLVRAAGNLAKNPATGGKPLPDLPDGIKNIPILGNILNALY